MNISTIDAIPMINVHTVCVLYPCSGVISPKLVTTQKYESLACDTVMAPAPIAITQSTDFTGVASPSTGRSGASIPAVVVIATVDEPCALFYIAASMNGKNIPTAESTSACCVI